MLTSIRGWSDHVDRYSRRAYTLFEVMLSLALILALMTLIGTALNTHLRSQFHNRLQVEEAQLARALLNRIANDIRAVVLDAERKENTAGSNPSDDEADDMDAYSDFTDDYESDSTSYDDDYLYEYNIVGSKKGIYGGLDWIQIDTYRTIPGERFAVNADNIYSDHYDDAEYLPELDLLSCGHKTVLYYLGYDTGMVEGDEEYQRGQKGTSVEPDRYRQGLLSSSIKYGLYYRELNRTMTEYAVEMGLDAANAIADNDEHLAPEVDRIEFYYYVNEDPNKSVEEGEWLDAWDMDAENGQLPLAIEIRLSIRRKNFKPSLIGGLMSNDDERERVATYALVVPLSREMIDLSVAEESSEAAASATSRE